MEKILVTVCCLAYNHEKYIKQCLEGFLKQKTDFAFEVIIHDDASTDATPEIIREYAEKYPEIIKPVFQKVNQYKHGRMKYIYSKYIYPHAQGKYFAYCEGDDYWTDEYKLQKQVDALLENPDCHMCVHRTLLVDKTGQSINDYFPQRDMLGGSYDSYRFMKDLTDGRFFHTSSFLCRAQDVLQLVSEMPDFYKIADLDDVPLLIWFGQLGSVYYIPDVMSCYRRETEGSWTVQERSNNEKLIYHKHLMINMYDKFDLYTKRKYSDLCRHWQNNERFMIAEIEHDYVEMAKPQYSEWLAKRKFRFQAKVKLLGTFWSRRK